MASARALMDLNSEHGTSELKEGMRFSSGTDATYFMQDYTYNANTRCCVKSSGTMKKYTCSHDKRTKAKGAVSNYEGETTAITSIDDSSIPGGVCGWEVRVSIKRERGGSQVFWVSYINDLHCDLCTSTAKATKRQLTKLATLRAAVLGDRKVKGKALVAMLQSRDGVNMQFSRSTLYRAKDAIVDSADGKWEESFRRLPFMLSDIRDLNPGTLVQLEVDQHQRFLRGFVALGANVQCQSGLLPLLGFDGAHSKHSKYNGVVLSLLGRDGNNKNITLATALVNVENEANILWFLEQCNCAGIQLSGRATFCDRGKIIGAAPQFFLHTGVLVTLRYCTLHIIRNLHKKFKKSGQAFDNAVWAIQGADTHKKYAEALDKMKTAFGDDIVKYLQEIGPAAWTVHANMSTYIPSVVEGSGSGSDMQGNIAGNHSGSRLDAAACASCGDDGDSCHLASPNGVLSASIETGSAGEDFSEAECECCQFAETHAVPMFKWRTSNFVESDNNALIENGVRDSDPCSAFYKITVEAMKKLSRRRTALEKWQKASIDLTPYAKKLWLKEKERVGEYMVEKSSEFVSYVSHPGDTTRSREVNVVLPSCTCSTYDQMRMACRHIFAALRQRNIEKQFIRAFHPAYLVNTYAATFADKIIALPVRDAPPGPQEVRPSPYYKQAGRRVIRRIASAGETGAKSTYTCKTCREGGHNRRTCRRHANECDEANPDLLPHSIALPSISSNIERDSAERASASQELQEAPDHYEVQPRSESTSRMSVRFLLE